MFSSILREDQNFLQAFKVMVLLSTYLIFDSTVNPTSHEISDENVAKVASEINDVVFGEQRQLERYQWESRLAQRCNWIFDPEKIRKKFDV